VRGDTENPRTTRYLHPRHHRLVTVRYDEPKPFALVENKAGALMRAALLAKWC